MDHELKILVIEDNPGDVAMLQDTLDGEPHLSFTCAASLADGVALARGKGFDTVLLDLTLPDSTGLETISRASAAFPSLPIVVMTGQANEETALQVVRLGGQDYLEKGAADRQTILRAIRYAIDRKRAQLDLQRAHDELEQKVRERTAELRQALDDLRQEVRQRMAAEEERRRAEREVIEAGEREQRRLGCDLHDSLGQKLTGLGLLAEGLAAELRDRAPEKSALAKQMASLAKDSVAQVRAMSKGLNPVGLGQSGLAAGLAELAHAVQAQSGILCVCRCDKGAAIEEEAQATHLYRIAQEAVNNAVRHSRAKHIWITLGSDGVDVTLEVRDDGVGIDRSVQGRGMGMHTMSYRAGVLHGTFEVQSAPNEGTVVRCLVPKSSPALGADAT